MWYFPQWYGVELISTLPQLTGLTHTDGLESTYSVWLKWKSEVATCTSLVLQNDRKCKYTFMFPKIYPAGKGFNLLCVDYRSSRRGRRSPLRAASWTTTSSFSTSSAARKRICKLRPWQPGTTSSAHPPFMANGLSRGPLGPTWRPAARSRGLAAGLAPAGDLAAAGPPTPCQDATRNTGLSSGPSLPVPGH